MEISARNNIKYGAIFSYILIFLNMVYGLFFAPYIISYIGAGNYGVYKTIGSLSSSLAIMDLGLGTTTTRYMALYSSRNDNKNAANFLAMVFFEYIILLIAIAFVGVILFFTVPSMYGSSFSLDELDLAKKLVLLLVFNLILKLFENLLNGVANGYGKFVFGNGIKTISMCLKMLLLLVILPIWKNTLLLVFLETFVTIAGIIAYALYIFLKLHLIPKLYKWEKSLFKESLGYTILMFIQSVTTQINGNIDNVLIGALQNSVSVTIYSMSLYIFSTYENLSGTISNIMLPSITKKIVDNASSKSLQSSVEKAGKFQFILLAAALGGFLVLGQDFYFLWLGEEYSDCYFLTLILIIPVTFSMVESTCLSILSAQNKMKYRTITLLISCICNFVITFIGIKIIGYWGAAIGTAVATILNLIFMNVYYFKKLNFSIFKLFSNIMAKIFICALIPTVIVYIIHIFLNRTWLFFVIDAIIFMCIYFFDLFIFGLTKDEKSFIFEKIKLRRAK